MTNAEIIRYRLFNQQIAESKWKEPWQIVNWMVAMQAQEYAMAKWSIGLRLPGSSDAMIENAFNNGQILRTHLMRPTWHFVTPADIRWLLKLTAPRVDAVNAFTYRQQGLDKNIFKRSHDIIVKSLEGGKQLLRTELQSALQQKKINADGIRLSALMMKAELEGLICSGPRRGNQFTYALLEERVPPAKTINKNEALATFAARYFASRGPATLKDFACWSGLSMKEAREGVAMLPAEFIKEEINGEDYIFIPASFSNGNIQVNFLMPDYDEYGMGYKDRSAIFNDTIDLSAFKNENPIFNRMIILDGKISGTWKRIITNDKVIIETVPFGPLAKTKQQALAKAIKKYCLFVGKEIEK